MSREDLNEQAGEILARARQLVSGRAHESSPANESVIAELSGECKRLRADINQLKKECEAIPPLETASRDDEILSLQLNEARLQSELAVLNRAKKSTDVNPPMWQASVHQQVQESLEDQNHLLAYLREQRDRINDELKKEKTLLSETRDLEAALEEKLMESQHTSPNSNSEVELRERITVAEKTIQTLRENLEQFCDDEIVQYSHEVESEGRKKKKKKKKKKKGEQERVDTMLLRGARDEARRNRDNIDFPSLSNIIKELISKTLSSPHAPYMSISTVWPPHGNLLLRSGVIQRHPDNPGLVRVTPFHL